MFFRELEAGNYFFFLGNAIPLYKTDDEHYAEGGSSLNQHAGPEERVVPLTVEQDVVRIGFYTIPIPKTKTEEPS